MTTDNKNFQETGEIDPDFRETILQWIDRSARDRWRVEIPPDKPRREELLAIIREAIDSDPLCGLELADGESAIRYHSIVSDIMQPWGLRNVAQGTIYDKL